MIYLNAASHGLPDPAVRSRIRDYLRREEGVGPDVAETEAEVELAEVMALAARSINAAPQDIRLVGSTTIGWNTAVQTLPLEGRRVLVAPGQWISDVAVLTRMGAEVDVIPMTPEGELDLDGVAKELATGIGAICIPQVSSLGGERYPVTEIGNLPRPEGTFYVVDGAQGLGQDPTDVAAMNCDVYAATTRKWIRGPRGTALVYVAPHMFEQMIPNPAPRIAGLQVRDQEIFDKPGVARFDAGALFAPQSLGLGAALKLFLANPDHQLETLADLATHVRSCAAQNGHRLAHDSEQHSAITTLRFPKDRVSDVKKRLYDAGITAPTPSPDCEPLRGAEWAERGFLRISPHVYNTKDDIDALFDAIQ